jgi:hypothetical protein
MQKVLEADFARIPQLLGAAPAAQPAPPVPAPASLAAAAEPVGPAVQLGLF